MANKNRAGNVTTIELPDGSFDVQDESGRSVLGPLGGPFRSMIAAEQACQMLNVLNLEDPTEQRKKAA